MLRFRFWKTKEFRYGDKKTIHRTNHLDVETDQEGQVVAVWFRCMALPFRQAHVSVDRAESMKEMNIEHKIKAVVFE